VREHPLRLRLQVGRDPFDLALRLLADALCGLAGCLRLALEPLLHLAACRPLTGSLAFVRHGADTPVMFNCERPRGGRSTKPASNGIVRAATASPSGR